MMILKMIIIIKIKKVVPLGKTFLATLYNGSVDL
jgi:hypothetical protein